MTYNFPPFTIVFLLGVVITLITSHVIWARRPAPGTIPLTFLMLCISWWLLAGTLEAGAREFSVKVLWGKSEFFGIACTGILWLFFALDYTGTTWWRRPRNLVLFLLLPVISLIVIWTNQYHNLFWTEIYPSPETSGVILVWEHGWLFWLFWVCQYCAFIFGIFILWRFVLHKPSGRRSQFVYILIGTVLPLVGNIIYVSGFSPVLGLDLTPFVFVLAVLLYAVSIFRFHFLDLLPVARNKLMENLPDGILVLDAEGNIADMNAATELFIGIKRNNSIDKPVEQVWLQCPEIIRTGTSAEAKTEIIINSSRGQRYLDISIIPLKDKPGKIVGKVVALRDISERKTAQKLLESLYDKEYKLRNELQQEMDKRNTYIRAIVHELKTPLTAILASGEMLELETRDGMLLSLVQNIRRSSLNLEHRTNELLDLARGEIGSLHLESELMDIKKLILELTSEMVPVASQRELLLETEIPEGLPLILGDRNRLRQVLSNLLSNSITYTSEGRITIRANKYNGKFVRVQVQDTGKGIDEELLQHLFDPYWRGRKEKDRLGGLGIGLALSKIIVELHYGKIWAENNPLKGTTFNFTLPIG